MTLKTTTPPVRKTHNSKAPPSASTVKPPVKTHLTQPAALVPAKGNKASAKPALLKPQSRTAAAPTAAAPMSASRDTTQARLITALKHQDGATIDQLMHLSGWQAHSVRGFISGVLRKKLQLVVDHQRGEQCTVYWIREGATSVAAGGAQ